MYDYHKKIVKAMNLLKIRLIAKCLMKSFHVHSNFSLEGWGCDIHTYHNIQVLKL